STRKAGGFMFKTLTRLKLAKAINKKSYAVRSLVLSKPSSAYFMSDCEFFHINFADINKPL
ncbi:hypothetical protein, partial [Providencia alcalifaciens]|uniref:hypothetical protein n=1 Tax=Providencia alcalifaciens TaxID=126385 RepID=UPI0032D9DFDD